MRNLGEDFSLDFINWLVVIIHDKLEHCIIWNLILNHSDDLNIVWVLIQTCQ